MKWEDISKRLPGRSAISCRLHYQNYLERRSEWDEERKNRLARLYERYVGSLLVWSRTRDLSVLLSPVHAAARSLERSKSAVLLHLLLPFWKESM